MTEEFPKKYEDLFTSDRTLRKCNIRNVRISEDNEDNDITKYILLLNSQIKKYQSDIFDSLIKIVWLFRKFRYKNARRIMFDGNGFELDGAFEVFMRNYVGFDTRLISMRPFLTPIISYFDDFFKNFDDLDPFTTKLEYPYTHMNLECLIFVHKMIERLELLKFGEEKEMKMGEFFDYVINYALSYNEKYGYVYNLSGKDKKCPIHIKMNKIDENIWKKKN